MEREIEASRGDLLGTWVPLLLPCVATPLAGEARSEESASPETLMLLVLEDRCLDCPDEDEGAATAEVV